MSTKEKLLDSFKMALFVMFMITLLFFTVHLLATGLVLLGAISFTILLWIVFYTAIELHH